MRYPKNTRSRFSLPDNTRLIKYTLQIAVPDPYPIRPKIFFPIPEPDPSRSWKPLPVGPWLWHLCQAPNDYLVVPNDYLPDMNAGTKEGGFQLLVKVTLSKYIQKLEEATQKSFGWLSWCSIHCLHAMEIINNRGANFGFHNICRNETACYES